jgi:hypothetical protein
MPLGSPPVGSAVRGRFTKWGDGKHWEWDGVYLGEDDYGRWFYAPAGTRCVRPGVDFVAPDAWVSLVPHEGCWVASFYPAGKDISVYVDMTTRAEWLQRDDAGWEVTMVDLDLDVVLTGEGDLFVDDEDEFAEHQVSLGYPPEVIALAERTAQEVYNTVVSGAEPFGTVGHARLAAAVAAAAGTAGTAGAAGADPTPAS